MVTKRISKKKVVGFDDLNDKLDLVIGNMATKDDIERIWEAMATKDDIADMATKDDITRLEMMTKRDLETMDEKFTKKFHENLIATEGLMKPLSDIQMNYAGTAIQLSRHEEWIRLIAQKTRVSLPL